VGREIAGFAFREPIMPAIIRYANRLSDLLFGLARVENGAGAEDVFVASWCPS
jgi:cob(I)alamin adenosyltransferase